MTMVGGIDPIVMNNEMLRASVLVCNIMILINDNPQGYDRSPVEDEEALHAGGLLGLLLDLLHHLHHHTDDNDDHQHHTDDNDDHQRHTQEQFNVNNTMN